MTEKPITDDTKLVELPDEMLLDVLLLQERWLTQVDGENYLTMLSIRNTCRAELLRRMGQQKN